MTTNVLFAGVGGQGIVTASDVLAQAAMVAGWSVKKAETHGMAQRGGSVVSHVRFSADGQVYSPLIPAGEAGFLVALEVLEGLRWLWMLRASGRIVCDDRRIPPITVSSGNARYPADAAERVAERGVLVPATAEASGLGEPRAANAVLLGALSPFLEIPTGAWRAAFAERLKPRALSVNWDAFARGRAFADVAP